MYTFGQLISCSMCFVGRQPYLLAQWPHMRGPHAWGRTVHTKCFTQVDDQCITRVGDKDKVAYGTGHTPRFRQSTSQHTLPPTLARKSFADKHAHRTQALGNRAARCDTCEPARQCGTGVSPERNPVCGHICAIICILEYQLQEQRSMLADASQSPHATSILRPHHRPGTRAHGHLGPPPSAPDQLQCWC